MATHAYHRLGCRCNPARCRTKSCRLLCGAILSWCHRERALSRSSFLLLHVVQEARASISGLPILQCRSLGWVVRRHSSICRHPVEHVLSLSICEFPILTAP